MAPHSTVRAVTIIPDHADTRVVCADLFLVRIDGTNRATRHQPGDVITVSRWQAQRLCATGAARLEEAR